MNTPFTPEEFTTLGFTELKRGYLENGDYYRWWRVMFGELNLDITYTIDTNEQVYEVCVELGEHQLRKDITREEILQLGRILKGSHE